MTTQLKQPWQGTDDESRLETYGGGASYWLATPWPRSELVFAAVLAVGAVVSVPLLWSSNPGGSLALGALGVAFAAYLAAASLWTLSHPDQAGHHLAAARHFNKVKWRKHPASLLTGLIVFGFVNGFARINDAGLGGRLIGGAASAALVAVFGGIAVWYARRKAHQNG